MLPDAKISQTSVECDRWPENETELQTWVIKHSGVQIARKRVCPEHNSPWQFFSDLCLKRPPLALVLASRGAGKSYLSALHTHLVSQCKMKHSTRILGGSLAQSMQVYRAMCRLAKTGKGTLETSTTVVNRLLKYEARYANGSEVAILAAASTSVRGPHVPSLKLDEIDEISSECREAAMGMCMGTATSQASILMSSTWHRVGGPMSEMLEQARAGLFPLYTFCAFDVLQRCPTSRSGVGPRYEGCDACPLKRYCHNVSDGGPPKAKRAGGHYPIDSLIQKMRATSERTFQAEYLCLGPRTDGLWFPNFSAETHVSTRAEYDPAYPVHLAIDSGVFTGAVFFQVLRPTAQTGGEEIHVFADHLVENQPAETIARSLIDQARVRCGGRIDLVSTDPAGGARNPVGPTVIGEYERAGLRPMHRWPLGSVADGLALVESFLHPADGRPRLFLHPRCVATIQALNSYRRARRGGQWQDYPEDPQHPHEDLVDALRGGLRTSFPDGRGTAPALARIAARSIL